MTPPRAYFSRKRLRMRRAADAALSIFLIGLVAVVLAPFVAGLIYQLTRG